MAKNRVVLRGSERPPIPNAENPRQADRHERFTVSVVLRRRSELTPPAGDFLSREHLVTVHGATASDLSVVRDFAREFGLQVLAESSAKRTIQLAGTVEAMEAAFGVLLETVEVNGKTHRQRVGPIHLPEDVAPVVRAVLGLDNRQQADTRSRFAATGSFRPFAAGGGALSPLDVA
ncbi:MAG TPA: protease pro-enzyme activation domain-containing protein, partial [Thermoanaerobaculia bacterium]|nr:protease pro-enzyme activation domain-containing protein [Thermoanaerobaculia bacterium]